MKPEPIAFYAEKYRKAFPFVLQYIQNQPFDSPEKALNRCYSTRIFERFLEWFGFVNVGSAKWSEREKALVTRTRIFDEVWE